MPKTKDAFALRNFDVQEYLRGKLSECDLPSNALTTPDFNINGFDELQRARKAYNRLHTELRTFGNRIARHKLRLHEYYVALLDGIVRSNDVDEYNFLIYMPRSKRQLVLCNQYDAIFSKIGEMVFAILGIIHNLDKKQRSYYTKIFAARLREARKAAGLTQEELAAQLGLKRSSYGLYEQARNEPNVSLLAILSKELNRSPNWFLGLSP